MNKTVSISLSGQVFQIDEQAYETLKNYLENLRRRFATAEGGQEIIADIESRIAELFLEKLNDRKQVITPADVEAMMQAMGKPEEFETATGEANQTYTSSSTAEPLGGGTRRLFRDPDEKVLGGVCSGLSAYFGIKDPIWMRILFIISPFITVGMALFIYVILWIIIPEAKTSSEKLQMRGEHVNISNIEKTIREDLNDLGNKFNDISNGGAGARVKGFLREVIDFTVKVIRVLLKVIGWALGVLLVMSGLAIIIGTIIMLFLPADLTTISINALYPAIFSSKLQFMMALLGLALVIVVPAIGILSAGFHLLIETRRRIKGLGWGLAGLFILGTILLSYSVTRAVVDFKQSEAIRSEVRLTQPVTDTLTLEGIREKGEGEFLVLPGIGEFVETESELIFTENVKLDIKKSATGNYELVRTYKAKGRKTIFAEQHANNIRHEFSQQDAVLTISEQISVPKADHYRNQEVELLLKVPEGKSVYLAESVVDLLYDVQNTHDMYDRDMVAHTWIMLPEGLTCLDCTPQEIIEGSVKQPHFGGGVNRKLEFKDFTSIDAHGAFNLEIKQGDFSVNVNGNDEFMDEAEVSVDGSRLSIQLRGMNPWMRERGTITVTLPELEHIEIKGTAHASISGFKQEKMSMEVKGASKVEVKSSIEELQLEEAGASTVTLSGAGDLLIAEVSGSSELRAFNYEVQRGEVEVSGASDVEVNIRKEMTAEAQGASKIRYKGLPKIVSSDVGGYSSIKPEQ